MLSSHSDSSFGAEIYPSAHHIDASASSAVACSKRLAELFSAVQLDRAMDKAARISQAIVAVFAAAPIEVVGAEAPAIEFAVEFMVPPVSLDFFHRQLESQLAQINPRYLTARYRGEFSPCIVRCIPSGAFHQLRVD